MRCSRSIAFAVLATFALKAAVPAPILVSHRHAGGEHEHVHDELPWHHHGHEPAAHHHHHDDGDHDHASPPSRGPGIHLAQVDGRHTHWQLPFQRLTPVGCATVLRVDALRRFVLPAPADPSAAATPVARSRGPPRSARS